MTKTQDCQLCKRPLLEKTRASPSPPLLSSCVCETCGRYVISDVIFDVTTSFPTKLHVLSHLCRTASDKGSPITITSENAASLIESVNYREDLPERMDQALLYLAERQSRLDEFVTVDYQKDYPLVLARDEKEFHFIVGELKKLDFLENDYQPRLGVRLTPEEWKAVARLRTERSSTDQAFVAMWFNEKLRDAYENGFKPALEELGYQPIRVDLAEHNGKIDDYIVAQIRRSALLVADFTGHRGGVYFEAGFALGLGIPVVWTCKETDIKDAHFDTRQYNHVVWSDPADLKDKLRNRVAATVPRRTP